MYDIVQEAQQVQQDIFYIILYSVVTFTCMLSSFYLLFRRGNAFAADITPPLRLRRLTALFFAIMAVGHLWYLPTLMFTSNEAIILWFLIGGLLDSALVIPMAFIVMLSMLQDRRRPLWPIAVMMAPFVVGITVCIFTRSETLISLLRCYFLIASIGFTIYMIRALKQYRRWLRDNYADMEHKEVWHSFVVMAFIMIMFVYYVVGYGGAVYEYIVQLCGLVVLSYLLWRVETLSDLSLPVEDSATEEGEAEEVKVSRLSPSTLNNIGLLLQQHCEDTQLYLQHDLTLLQLAKAIGTNRFYLSQYFSSRAKTYNAYINDLRINHFVSLYHEAVASQRPFTVQSLAQESGFRNYNTFSSAFKRITEQSVTAWMKEQETQKGS